MQTWLLLDCNYLCHRAFHAIGTLQHNEIKSGMVYGFLRDIIALQDMFSTKAVIFSFDNGRSLRTQLLPGYKSRRHLEDTTLTPQEVKDKAEFYKQINMLRDTYLPELGYRNVFHSPGYEGDDIIAGLCEWLPPTDEKIIVTADADLLQCLQYDNTRCYNPRTRAMVTFQSFVAEWGIEPDQWPDVKAMAGCTSDDIPGIKGIGEVTAAKFLRDELKLTSKQWQKIQTAPSQKTWRDNLKLVRLPYPGCPRYKPVPDSLSHTALEALKAKYGIKSLGNTPQAGRAGKVRNGQPRGEGFGL